MKAKFVAAAAALLMGAGSANAAIVTFNTPINVPNDFDGVYINFLTGGTSTSEFSGWDWNPYNSGAGLSFFWSQSTSPTAGGVGSTTTGPYTDLAPGSVVSAASTFTLVTATTATAEFKTTGTHILGFRFFNEDTSAINYGYVTMTATGTTGFPLVINGWSFDNTGAAITVPTANGAVPEPATWAMMMLGFGAMGAALRRRPKVATRIRYA